ncbi:L-threonylcarbamoyladenylate synthase [Anaerosacchariphilus polymeriproducens]|uniref:Threonylcarbamoyl-AMP synthase n=1 Tax=Anaerosacchariphilus polymeriproducens TaxID=1812858 RepID=A0A371AY04_9FIRM|nr:L-threonylcarbamoyladenylate synthase [Anaerosacchariphilus polymeriproducens]RDU24458.1 threonylcarbamoyl-AMP synthase [Anaerosacchariphilus polymeriproducens]
MNTQIVKVDIQHLEKDIDKIQAAGNIIMEGGLIAFPTETVYGLGADGLKKEGSSKIYEAKGRPSDNPLIIHISRIQDLEEIVLEMPGKAKELAKAFWPGPLTMVFKKSKRVPYETTGGLETVAVRMPNHPVALALIEHGGGYIAAPSANTSGKPSPTLASHVADDLNGKIDMILDGGPVGIGIESTILDMTTVPPIILRPGFITKNMIEEVIGSVEIDPVVLGDTSQDFKPKAPGMKYKHYAPKADLIILEGNMEHVISKINQLIVEKTEQNMKVGVIGTDETISFYTGGQVKSIGSREDEETIARRLYRILREFDKLDIDVIYSESFSTPQMGQAIMNRLLKAAGHQILNVKGV